jgi:hypothetical protein
MSARGANLEEGTRGETDRVTIEVVSNAYIVLVLMRA